MGWDEGQGLTCSSSIVGGPHPRWDSEISPGRTRLRHCFAALLFTPFPLQFKGQEHKDLACLPAGIMKNNVLGTSSSTSRKETPLLMER